MGKLSNLFRRCERCGRPPDVITRSGKSYCDECFDFIITQVQHIFWNSTIIYRDDIKAMASECDCGLIYIWMTDKEWKERMN